MKHELDPAQFFEEVAASACEELFARYGVTVRRAAEGDEPVSPDFLLCSVIGFSGRDVCGTLVLALTDELSGKSNPVSGSPSGTVSARSTQRDWVGELSNQLLGQIKIELLRHGVEIYVNLPAVLQGQHLAPLPRRQLKPLKFTLANGAAAVWIELEARAGFKIEPATRTDEGPAPGDTLMFD
jgi:CheY-specific phosphatase CheX